MKRWMLLLTLLALTCALGCYHATIETGLPESGEMISQPWAASWVFGLVPPSTVSAAGQCPNGVARVETQLSFLNQLVGILTFGIFTPMEIRVSCASGASGELTEPDLELPEGASESEIQAIFAQAAQRAVEEGRPIFVRY